MVCGAKGGKTYALISIHADFDPWRKARTQPVNDEQEQQGGKHRPLWQSLTEKRSLADTPTNTDTSLPIPAP